MIACDCCRDVNQKAGDFKVSLIRIKPGEQRATRAEAKTTPLHLCEGCVDLLWSSVLATLPISSSPPTEVH